MKKAHKRSNYESNNDKKGPTNTLSASNSPFSGQIIEFDPSWTYSNTPSPVHSECESKESNPFIFKDSSFVLSSKNANNISGKKSRTSKSLKQILTAERTMQWKPSDVTYSSIDAPPSFTPAKKYSDITGLIASYADPLTKLNFTTAEEFSRIRVLPSDLINGYLALRKANTPVP